MAENDANTKEPTPGELQGTRPALKQPAPGEPPHDPTHEGHIETDLPNIRTFADDLSVEIKKKGPSLSTIVTAERERAARELALDQDTEETPRPGKWKNIVLLSGTILLLLVSAAIAGTAVYFSQAQDEEQAKLTQSIIFPNKVVDFTVPEYLALQDALATERTDASLQLGEIERVDITLEGATTSAQTLLGKFDPPPGLLREARSVMFGVHSFDRNQPFIIIEVTQFDRAFGAMLDWEEEMGRGLGNFYKPLNGKVPPTLEFTDRVYQNIDTRVSQSEWPILYAFPRRDVLVITTNQYTLQEILTRLNAQSSGTVLP